MSDYLLTELPYRPDSASLFESVVDLPWAMFLDSGRPRSEQGRYDILVAEPRVTLTTWGRETVIECNNRQSISERSPFALIQEYLGSKQPGPAHLPFCGGAVGYFGYDLLGTESRERPVACKSTANMPDMAIGIYD
ncbi:MAG: hypothetical protein V7629_17705 [Motiliproteus sp.]